MTIKFSNNAISTLASGINNSATSITLASGDGAKFPSLTGSEYFRATLIDASNNLEIVKVTARSSDVLTVTRAQENTTARAFATGDRIELRITAQSLLDAATTLTSLAADLDANSSTIDMNGNEFILDADGDTSSDTGSEEAAIQRQFWIIKHGIKASGMPAWGPTHSDERIWKMVAFLQSLPSLTPDQYQILTARGNTSDSTTTEFIAIEK